MSTEIIPNLFVGTRDDASVLGSPVPPDWLCLAVTEYRDELPNEPVGSIDMQFMDRGHGRAKIDRLDAIAALIDQSLGDGRKVLVHCIHAHERSPLAIAWYLAWSEKFPSFTAAYLHVQAKHPSTERRDKWLAGAVPRRQTPVIGSKL